ncbi:hypothetical protein OH492_23530 [Vibrio chagasii]|nr:hypothetical protein [Vibrio chagasii]
MVTQMIFRREHLAGDLQAEFGEKTKEELEELNHIVADRRSCNGEAWSIPCDSRNFWSYPSIRSERRTKVLKEVPRPRYR